MPDLLPATSGSLVLHRTIDPLRRMRSTRLPGRAQRREPLVSGRNRNAVRASEALGIGYAHALRLLRAVSEPGVKLNEAEVIEKIRKRLEEER